LLQVIGLAGGGQSRLDRISETRDRSRYIRKEETYRLIHFGCCVIRVSRDSGMP
jgi:hypothetical protein